MKTPTQLDHHARLQRVRRHIEAKLDEPLGLEELARVACFSPYHFHRIFRGESGESVAHYVRRLKLERAARALRWGDAPVTEVALDAGYEANASFTRAFRRSFGRSPSEWRAGDEKSAVEPMAVELPELEVELVERSPQPALTLRHLGPYPEVGSAWQMLLAYVFRVLSPVGPIELLGVPWDDPDVTAPEHLRCDVGVALRDLHSLEPEPPFEIRELPGGRYAECMHRGAYEALSDSYAYVCGVWAPKHGEELRHAPSIEIYERGPAAGVDSRDYRTRLFVPLD